jgi:hypothetical protein
MSRRIESVFDRNIGRRGESSAANRDYELACAGEGVTQAKMFFPMQSSPSTLADLPLSLNCHSL